MPKKPKNGYDWAYYPQCPQCRAGRGKPCKDQRKYADGRTRMALFPHPDRQSAATRDARRRNSR